MRDLGLGADVASGGELSRVLEAGFDPAHVEFSGPGKRASELALAIESGVGSVNVESIGELDLLAKLADERGTRARVGLRVNPSTKARAGLRMAGATQFGISEEDIPTALDRLRRAPSVELTGLHVHVGSQVLEAGAVIQIYRTCLELARSLVEHTGRPLQKVNFGGGWGVTYFDGQKPLDLAATFEGISQLIEDKVFATVMDGARLIVEPGRFLVAESGVYATRVLYRKRSGETEFAVVDGGLNTNYLLAGGMGQVIRRNFQLDALTDSEGRVRGPSRAMTVAGCLCTPQDVLAHNVECADVSPGDYVLFFNCGAYGATASPMDFLSHPPPAEVLVDS
jgi:diaminopimelate decarboxylase